MAQTTVINGVAKSYADLAKLSEPYEKDNGRMYIKVQLRSGKEKEVRWYGEDGYNYDGHQYSKQLRTLKDVLGFEKGYITIFKGDTYSHLDWFREEITRYHKVFGWYIPSELALITEVPEDLEQVQLKYEDVFIDENTLKDEKELKSFVYKLTHDQCTSEYVGEIGDMLTLDLKIKKIFQMKSYYGYSADTISIYNMVDEDNNIFIWKTSVYKEWEEGDYISLRGKVKEHKLYGDMKETVLTRCKEV